MNITGRDGISLREQWGDEPTAYLGITMPNFPNLFCLYGPGTNLARGSEPVLPFRMPDALHDGRHPQVLSARAQRDRGPQGRPRRIRRALPAEIGQLVWAHPSITHSHYKNPARQGLHAVALAALSLLGVDPRPSISPTTSSPDRERSHMKFRVCRAELGRLVVGKADVPAAADAPRPCRCCSAGRACQPLPIAAGCQEPAASRTSASKTLVQPAVSQHAMPALDRAAQPAEERWSARTTVGGVRDAERDMAGLVAHRPGGSRRR